VNNECVPQPTQSPSPPPSTCTGIMMCSGTCLPGKECLPDFNMSGLCSCTDVVTTSSSSHFSSALQDSSNSTFTYGANKNPSFTLDSNSPGQSPSHKLSFDVTQGELETYMAVVTYPDAFMFNQFTALGPTDTQVGTFGLDVDSDGADDIVFSIRALDNETAYVDVSLDGSFTPGIDPTIEYKTGSNVFTTILPFGGDGNPNTLDALLSARVTLMLNNGILTNPNTPGKYTLTGDFTSVDPDTDGANDNMNESPHTFSANLVVKITDIEVEIDIKPGTVPNSINPTRAEVIPVAILTTPSFDATSVAPMSVKFGPAGAMEIHNKGHLKDVDGDGDTDMILHFQTQSIGINPGDTEACLTGETVDGNSILGCDSIKTVP